MDIRKTLNIPNAYVIKGKLTRNNLHYIVKKKSDEYVNDIIEYINSKENQCGIIYCLTKDEAEQMSNILNENNIKSAFYHSGIPESRKNRVQADWMKNDIQIMTATVAFGMGT